MNTPPVPIEPAELRRNVAALFRECAEQVEAAPLGVFGEALLPTVPDGMSERHQARRTSVQVLVELVRAAETIALTLGRSRLDGMKNVLDADNLERVHSLTRRELALAARLLGSDTFQVLVRMLADRTALPSEAPHP